LLATFHQRIDDGRIRDPISQERGGVSYLVGGKKVSKTMLRVGNTVICCLTASFFAWDHVGKENVIAAPLLGAMAGAVGVLFGGLLVGYIGTFFMKEKSDRYKNVAYFCGVLFLSGAAVFNKIYGF
jgi:hypothetical protein